MISVIARMPHNEAQLSVAGPAAFLVDRVFVVMSTVVQ
jgi:hypothetical protein